MPGGLLAHRGATESILSFAIQPGRGLMPGMETTCSTRGCRIGAQSTVLTGATRVAVCWRHEAAWLERYPEDRDLVWPLGLAVEAPVPSGLAGIRGRGRRD